MTNCNTPHPVRAFNSQTHVTQSYHTFCMLQSGPLQELLDVTHLILGELEKEHKAQKAPGATAEAAKPDADADELREKFRIVRVSLSSG